MVSALNMKILLFVHFRKDHRDLLSETSWNQILNFTSTTIHKSLDMSPRQPYSIAIFVSNNSPCLKKVDFGHRELSYFSISTVKRNLIVLGKKTELKWGRNSISDYVIQQEQDNMRNKTDQENSTTCLK